MRHLIFVAFLGLISACKGGTDCCVAPPEFSEFNGEWDLVRIVNGFAQIDQTGEGIGYSEVLTIDAGYKIFTRSRDNIKQETSTFKADKEAGQDALILVDEQMYQWYSFEEWEGKYCLVLYERCPLGAQLADGSYYYYSKR